MSSKKLASRARLSAQVLALFDEITTSDTTWSLPGAVDSLTRDVALHALGLHDRDRARKVLQIALEGATAAGISDAVRALRADRDAMVSSVAEDYERKLAEWRAQEPKRPAPIAPAALSGRRAQ